VHKVAVVGQIVVLANGRLPPRNPGWLQTLWDQITNKNNVEVTVFGFAALVVAVWIGWVFYKKSERVRKPSWYLTTNNLIRDRGALLPKLTVLYDQHSVDNLSVSTFTFWNAGKETIRRSDIPSACTFRVMPTAPDVHLLGARLLGCNERTNQFSVHLGEPDKGVAIDFEYLDQDEGAVFQVVHTGQSSAALTLEGKVMAGKPLQRLLTPQTQRASFYLILFLLGILFFNLGGGPQASAFLRPGLTVSLIILGVLVGLLLVATDVLRTYVHKAGRPGHRPTSKRHKIARVLWWLQNQQLVPVSLADLDNLPFKGIDPVLLAQLEELTAWAVDHGITDPHEVIALGKS
jgi:hypothetical protein